MAEARWNWIRWLWFGALCLCARAVVFAQPRPAGPLLPHSVEIQSPQFGSLAGRLTDLHSDPLAGVSIVLRNQATGAEARTTTAKNGAFRFVSLDAGEYTLEAAAPHLGHGHLEGIFVTGGTEAHVQAAMNFEPGPPALLVAAAPIDTAPFRSAVRSRPWRLPYPSEPPRQPRPPQLSLRKVRRIFHLPGTSHAGCVTCSFSGSAQRARGNDCGPRSHGPARCTAHGRPPHNRLPLRITTGVLSKPLLCGRNQPNPLRSICKKASGEEQGSPSRCPPPELFLYIVLPLRKALGGTGPLTPPRLRCFPRGSPWLAGQARPSP